MAEAIVSIVLKGFQGFNCFLVAEAKFLSGVGDQVEHAQIELYLMRGYLKDADAKQDDDLVRIWVGIIRDAAYDLEDIAESFALKVASRKKGSRKFALKSFACILNEGIYLHKTRSDIEKIATKLSKLRLSLDGYKITREIGGSVSVTSFERQQDYRQTYAHHVDEHPELTEDLEHLAKQLVTREKVQVFCIRSDAGKEKERGNEKMETDKIAKELCLLQQKKKCLVVLDDIWTREAWNSLRAGFPAEETGSRIIITTRNRRVVPEASENVHFQKRPLNDDLSWKLFKETLRFGRDNADSKVDKQKEKLGREMLKHCAGLPLAIIALAELLASKETVQEWKTVKENVGAYVERGTDLETRYKGENNEGTSRALALSYECLPYHLKPCFLYLGHFPEGHEIPVKRLIQLWIAEGFIYSASGELLEDVAYNCLNELVVRCMVEVGHHGSTNKIKFCRLHEVMRDLCLLRAKHENFVHISDSSATATNVSPTGKVRRRVYLGKGGDIPADGQLRSLLYFTQENLGAKSNGKPVRLRFQNFKLLRVLSLEEFEGEVELPSTIGNLVHLRFFSVKGCVVTRFPSSVSKLICLQTLDLRCSKNTDMKRVYRNLHNVIRDLEQWRHLYLPARELRVAENSLLPLATLRNLHTLVNVSNCDFDLHYLAGLPNLRKMSMVLLEDGMKDSVTIESDHLQSLSLRSSTKVDVSERIQLRCRNICKLQLEGQIAEILEGVQQYRNLTTIKLYGTTLKDEHIKILEKLCLKSLKLEGVALEIPTLVFSKQGFQGLEFLSISRISHLKEWRVEKGAMHHLHRLQIKCCLELKELPDGLRHIGELEELTITMPREFCCALQEGGKDFHKIKHVAVVKLGSDDTMQMLQGVRMEKMEADKVANVSAGTSAMPLMSRCYIIYIILFLVIIYLFIFMTFDTCYVFSI